MTGFRMETNTKQVRNELGQIVTQIPEVEREIAADLAKIFAEEVNRSVEQTFERFTGNLARQSRPDNLQQIPTQNGTAYELSIDADTGRGVDYAAWHEHADTGHFVSPHNPANQPLNQWAVQRFGSQNIPRLLYVRPKPFVKPAMQRISRRARQYMGSETNAYGELLKQV